MSSSNSESDVRRKIALARIAGAGLGIHANPTLHLSY